MKKACIGCNKLKEHFCNGYCTSCYSQWWYSKHPGKKSEHDKKYYQKNKDKIKKQIQAYRVSHKENRNEYEKNYYKKFPEKQKQRSMKYLHTPKGKIHTKRQNKLRCRKNRGQIIRENILKYGTITCENCKKECPENFNTDHIIPISKGGGNNLENLQVLCIECNVKKGIKIENYKIEVEMRTENTLNSHQEPYTDFL